MFSVHAPLSGSISPQHAREPMMKKSLSYLVAALFVLGSANVLAAKHMAGEKDAKKPSAEECKKDPKMAGCEKAETKKDKK